MSIKGRFIYFIEYSWLFILLLFACMVYANQKIISLFFNSDGAASLLLFRDLLIEHGHYKDWAIPSAVHFFPGMPIWMLTFLIVKNLYLYFLTVIWVIIISIYFAVRFIYSQCFLARKATFCALTATTGILLLTFSYHPPYNILFLSFYHVEEFIAGLFLLGIQIKLINKDKLAYTDYILVVLSVLIAFGCGLSDLLFFVQFASPIFFTYSFFFLTKRISFFRCLLFSSFIVLPTIAGLFSLEYIIPNYVLSNYLSHPSLTKVSFNTIITQSIVLINTIKASSNYFIKVIYGIFYLSLIFIIGSKLFAKDKKNIRNNIDKTLFLSLFVFFSVLSTIGSVFCLTDIHYVVDRYMFPLFFFPFLLFFIPIDCLNGKLLNSKIFVCFTVVIFLYMVINLLIFISKPGFKFHTSYYPEYVRCIDKALRGYGHNGVAQYWEANLITILSKENVRIVPVINDLHTFPWLVNINRFQKPINFIIVDRFSSPFTIEENLLYRRYGMPDKVVVCGKRKILIYSRTFTLN